MALIALLKLSSRFPSYSERIKGIIVQNKGNLVLELQQRSIEFNRILQKHQKIRSALVERMPVLDEATFSGRRAGSLPTAISTSSGAPSNLPNGIAKPATAPIPDLLDLSSDDVPAPSSSGGDFPEDLLGVDLLPTLAPSGAGKPPKASTDVLLDLLSIGTSLPVQTGSSASDILSSSQDDKASFANFNGLASLSSLSANATSPVNAAPMMNLLDGHGPGPQKPEENGQAYPSLVAYESSSLRVMFNFSKQPGSPQTTLIQATFTNLSSNVYNDFLFQAAVPKVKSVIYVFYFQKSLVMRVRIAYKTNNKDVLEERQINNFPQNL
ncbi:hypothetical protein Gohar_021551 [Gossypium harknessii]|uniref:GAE domain-containing protein n=1 Tax=Gossypium harknessii TaxID=34285 RepID=A0A7J9IE91_9ROSI|nr:hypothetical protein [Gossypium harknessii]